MSGKSTRHTRGANTRLRAACGLRFNPFLKFLNNSQSAAVHSEQMHVSHVGREKFWFHEVETTVKQKLFESLYELLRLTVGYCGSF